MISGSGDAATVAFNEAVTPHAAQFGLQAIDMGSMAALGGTLGRTMSPIAGATIIAPVLPVSIRWKFANVMLWVLLWPCGRHGHSAVLILARNARFCCGRFSIYLFTILYFAKNLRSAALCLTFFYDIINVGG